MNEQPASDVPDGAPATTGTTGTTDDLAARLAAAEAAAAAAEAVAVQARAEAEAAAARAALAQARLAATAGQAPAAAPPAATPPAAAPAPTGDAAWADQVRAGYTFPGASLALGALVEDGTAHRDVLVALPLAMMNRHGLVAGATGTGKTRTLQLMAEGLSAAGVPVFLADMKGDLSGIGTPGTTNDRLATRAADVGQDWQPQSFPVELFTLGGQGAGTPIRTTVTDFGPLLLAKVLGLNETQASSLALIVHWADSQGLALLDLKDLQAVIAHLVSDEGKAELKGIGGLSSATAGVILREIVALQGQGADVFFGEPAFSTSDLMRTSADGRGIVSALELPAVQDRPALFSTFLLWLLADLFSELPEVGDVDKPNLVFFFDEAHLLFADASKDFLTQVVQTVRLIRSKGVGVFFVTQSPRDLPDDVLAQLGNRVQHALRAHTPDEEKALRAAVRTFPRSPVDLEQLLTSLGTGEAVVTVLDEDGSPTPVAWTRLRAPSASMKPLEPAQAEALVTASPLHSRYGAAVDRESAYELLHLRDQQAVAAAERASADAAAKEQADAQARELEKLRERAERDAARSRPAARSRGNDALGAFLRSAGTVLGREITRSVLGTRRR
ncbi:MAG TPA: helicase HerA-like domain-containing protein [Actinotalea sp.]